MFFASPLWLLALLPWTGGVIWLLWGRRRKTPVPFLELWRGPELHKPAKRALQPPPVFLALAIVATLMAVLAAGGPRLSTRVGGAGNAVTIIVDRGISMSATAGGLPRFVVAARRADDAIRPALADMTPVDLIVLPGRETTASDMAHWAGRAAALSPTAIDTQAILEETIRERLVNSTGAVIVISDRRLPVDDARLIQFSPDMPIDNVGIVRIAARETPSPQVMVRLRNDSDRRSVGIAATSGSQQARQMVDLPPRGQERDYFLDLAKFDAVIEAAIDVKDDQPADDRAWLTREGSFPKIEPRAPLSPQLRRMIDVYSRSRPASEGSLKVAVVAAEADLPGEAPAVWIAPATGPIARGTVIAANHPATANVAWSAFPAEIQTAGDPPRDWTPLVSVGDDVIVAASSEPTRKIWIGFDAPSWSATPDFVVFWANVFTWVGQGQKRFSAYPLGDYDPAWKPVEPAKAPPAGEPGMWPGVYRTDEGALRAYNAPQTISGDAVNTTSDWRQRVFASQGTAKSGYDLSPVILIVGLACLAAAAGTWKRPGVRK